MAAALVVSLASARAGADEYDDPEPAPSKPSPRPAPTTKPAGATEAPRAFPDDDAALGAAARALLGEIARLACSSAPAEPLAATCAVARGPSPTLSALRAAALADALALALAH
ncbi:MAG TPA: hypothetical protein PK141_28185, partial [Polyangiaceae bacterium]|nr:hypothetical protein [Polyangiaceae bacterium]